MEKKVYFILILILSLSFRLFFIFFSSQEHLIQLTSDDFYIYVQIMRNWVEQGLISFDGISLTNGFHPLYGCVLYPFFKIFGSVLPYEKIALTVLSIFDVLTAIFVYKIVSIYHNERVSKLTSYFWLFNPGVIFIVLLGVESAIVGFVFSIFIYTYLSVKRKEIIGYSSVAGIATLYTLLFLARTEFILLAIPLAVDFFLFLRKSKVSYTKILKRGVLAILVFLLVVFPWFAYSYFFVGSISQDSGNAIVYLTHTDYRNNPTIQTFILKTGVFLTKYFFKLTNNLGSLALFGVILGAALKSLFPARRIHLKKGTLRLFWLILIISLVTSFLIPEPNLGLSEDAKTLLFLFLTFVLSFISAYLLTNIPLEKNLHQMSKDNFFLICFVIFHVVFYTFYFWLVQAWYLFSVLLVLTILFVPLLFSYFGSKRHNILIILIFVLLLTKIIVLYLNPTMPWHINHLDGARWLSENTPPNSVIGATDAGIIAYFSERTTLNLDGLVNKEAHLAAKENRLNEYILSSDTSYIFGNKLKIPGFEPIKIISSNPHFNQTIWKSKNSQQ